MLKILLSSLLCLPLVASAQNAGGMQIDKAKMQQMMQQMQGMQDCMANIDPVELETFQKQAKEMDAEVKALCASGKRDEAMSRAMVFGKKVASSKVMQDMKKCGEGMKNMMQNLPKVAQSQDENGTPRHICDE
jgi:cytochrome c556